MRRGPLGRRNKALAAQISRRCIPILVAAARVGGKTEKSAGLLTVMAPVRCRASVQPLHRRHGLGRLDRHRGFCFHRCSRDGHRFRLGRLLLHSGRLLW